MKKQELIIMIIVLAMALSAMAVIHFAHSEGGAYVVVTMDNQEIGRYPLEEDGVYELTGYGGGHNELHVKDGKAFISNATCPDKLCVKQKEISLAGEMLVCLPNHIIVKIEGAEESGLDGVVR